MDILELDKQLAVHEAVCAERYAQIMTQSSQFNRRLEKIEKMVMGLIIIVVALHPSVVELVKGIL